MDDLYFRGIDRCHCLRAASVERQSCEDASPAAYIEPMHARRNRGPLQKRLTYGMGPPSHESLVGSSVVKAMRDLDHSRC